MSTEKQVIKIYLRRTGIPGIESLIKYMETNSFFTAPCSVGHHLACDGGLAQHSLSVFKILKHIVYKYDIPISINTITITALLHDICKIHLYEKINDKWQYKKILKPTMRKRHGNASRLIIQTFIQLTEQQKEMINWHMGPYTEYYDFREPGDFLKWSNDKKNENKNASLLLYFCDHISSMFLEES